MRIKRRLVGKIEFETASGAVLGDKRIRLLEAIAEHGSLNRAAKTVPLSYKAAWDALDSMNNLADSPLVVRTTGGRNGGGTRLTEHGLQMITLYRAMESSQQDMLDRVSSMPALAAGVSESAPLLTLLRRMAVKTSARNQFIGTVVSVVDRGGMTDVRLRLSGGDELIASITPESVETMILAPGVQAYALIKAPWVNVTATRPRAQAINSFDGVIDAVDGGSASTRLTVTSAGGRAIAAAMSNAIVAKRGLKRGACAWATFAHDSVILATFD